MEVFLCILRVFIFVLANKLLKDQLGPFNTLKKSWLSRSSVGLTLSLRYDPLKVSLNAPVAQQSLSPQMGRNVNVPQPV